MRRPRPRACSGFALVELLIASLLLATAGALLAGGLLWANRSAEARAQRALLTELLAVRLNSLEDTLTSDVPAAGTFEPTLPEASWTLEVQPLEAPESPLRRVTLTVTYQGQTAQAVTQRLFAEPSP